MPWNSFINDPDNAPGMLGPVDPPALVLEIGTGEQYTHPLTEPELVFVSAGEVHIAYTSGRLQHVGEGYFTLNVPGHFVSLTALADVTLLICRLHSGPQLYERFHFTTAMCSFTEEDFCSLRMNDAIHIFLAGFTSFIRKGFLSQEYYNIKMAELLYLLNECYSKSEIAALFHPFLGGEMTFRNFVYTHIRNVNSVKEMALLANMSPTGFRSKFMKIMGESPSDMIVRYKTAMIKQTLLFTDLPLKEISEKYGFSSIHVFTRFCNRNLGAAPGSIRKAGTFSDFRP